MFAWASLEALQTLADQLIDNIEASVAGKPESGHQLGKGKRKMDKFRVAISGDFVKADGQPAFADWDMTPLDGPTVEHFFTPSGAIPPDVLEDADAVVLLTSPFGAQNIPANSRLAVVARFGVGYDSVDVPACTGAHIAVAVTASAVRRPVSVMALTFIFALSQKLMVKSQLGRIGPDGWARKTDHNGQGLIGRTVGILGFGSIAREFVGLAKPFGLKFVAHDPYVPAAVAAEHGVQIVGKEALFREADFVLVLCLLTEETRHLVDADMLGLMKPTAYLINVARGPIIDQKALTRALRSGRIAGAALDVLEKEPPDSNDPILTCDDAIITPHALCWTDQMFQAIGADVAGIVHDMMHGCMPQGIVNCGIIDDSAWLAKLKNFEARFGVRH